MGKPLKKVRHEEFCWQYLKDMNGTNAAIRAGYSTKGAHVSASKLLSMTKVRERIHEIIAERAGESGISAEWVITKLKEVVERCMQPTPVMHWDNDLGQLVQKENENGQLVFEFDSVGANRALELLGRHVGLFEKDNLQRGNTITVEIEDNHKQSDAVNNANTNEAGANQGQDSNTSVLALLPTSAAV